MTLDEKNIHSLAAPYALDALDDIERRRFEDHLASGCASCNEEVVGFLEVATALATEELVLPGEGLRDAVLAASHEVRQVGPRVAPRRLAAALRRVAVPAAAALALVAGGLGAVVVSQQQRIDDLRQDAVVASLLEQPDVVVSTAEAEQGVVRVVSSTLSGQAVVIAAGFQPLPDDLTYQLWLVEEASVSAGLLEVSAAGSGEQVLAGGIGTAVALGISVEPAGGSEAPTSSPVAVVELPTA